MQDDPSSLVEQVKTTTSWEDLPHLIEELTSLREAAVKALLDQQPGLVTSRLHFVSAKVFARVGFPTNAPALEFMVSDASNSNSSTWADSREALLSIGAPALPAIEDAISYYRRKQVNNLTEIAVLSEIENEIRKRVLPQ